MSGANDVSANALQGSAHYDEMHATGACRVLVITDYELAVGNTQLVGQFARNSAPRITLCTDKVEYRASDADEPDARRVFEGLAAQMAPFTSQAGVVVSSDGNGDYQAEVTQQEGQTVVTDKRYTSKAGIDVLSYKKTVLYSGAKNLETIRLLDVAETDRIFGGLTLHARTRICFGSATCEFPLNERMQRAQPEVAAPSAKPAAQAKTSDDAKTPLPDYTVMDAGSRAQALADAAQRCRKSTVFCDAVKNAIAAAPDNYGQVQHLVNILEVANTPHAIVALTDLLYQTMAYEKTAVALTIALGQVTPSYDSVSALVSLANAYDNGDISRTAYLSLGINYSSAIDENLKTSIGAEIREGLASADPEEQKIALKAARNTKDPRLIDEVLPFFDAGDPFLRYTAYRTALDLAPERAIDLVEQRAVGEPAWMAEKLGQYIEKARGKMGGE